MIGRNFNVGLVFGASLAGGFNGAIGGVLGGLRDVNQSVGGLQHAVGQLAAAWGSFTTIRSAVRISGDFDEALRRLGSTGELTEQEMANLRRTIHDLSAADETNQSIMSLVEGVNALVTAGMDKSLATNPQLLRAIGKAATATESSVGDLAQTAFALQKHFNIDPGRLQEAFDIMATGAGEGAFELKDMASAFPDLLAKARLLGLEGTEGVATMVSLLQQARTTAASPVAANNMANFLSKVFAPDVLKNARKFHVDFVKIKQEAEKAGKNPLEEILYTIDRITEGGKIEKLNKIFGDQQVKDFLIAVLPNLKAYGELKAKAFGESQGVVDRKYTEAMRIFNEQTQSLSNSAERAGESYGKVLMPRLGALIGMLTPIIDRLGQLAESWPRTTLALTGFIGVITLLPPMILLGKLALLGMAQTAVVLKFGLLGLAVGVKGLGLIMGGLTAVLSFVRTAALAMNLAFLANPIVLVGALIVGAAALIYKYWDEIKSFFIDFWTHPRQKFVEFGQWVLGWGQSLLAQMPFIGQLFADKMTPNIGDAMKQAEQQGAKQLRAGGGPVNPAYQAAGGSKETSKVEVTLDVPSNFRARARSSSPNVKLETRTGPALTGVN